MDTRLLTWRTLKWVVPLASLAVTAAILLFGPFELSLLALVGYLIYRAARIGLIVWLISRLGRWRRGAAAPAAGGLAA